MIKPKADIVSLCDKKFNDLSVFEMRLIIMNYIYYKTGKTVPEVMTAPFIGNNLEDIAKKLTEKARIAYEYFEQ